MCWEKSLFPPAVAKFSDFGVSLQSAAGFVGLSWLIILIFHAAFKGFHMRRILPHPAPEQEQSPAAADVDSAQRALNTSGSSCDPSCKEPCS